MAQVAKAGGLPNDGDKRELNLAYGYEAGSFTELVTKWLAKAVCPIHTTTAKVPVVCTAYNSLHGPSPSSYAAGLSVGEGQYDLVKTFNTTSSMQTFSSRRPHV